MRTWVALIALAALPAAGCLDAFDELFGPCGPQTQLRWHQPELFDAVLALADDGRVELHRQNEGPGLPFDDPRGDANWTGAVLARVRWQEGANPHAHIVPAVWLAPEDGAFTVRVRTAPGVDLENVSALYRHFADRALDADSERIEEWEAALLASGTNVTIAHREAVNRTSPDGIPYLEERDVPHVEREYHVNVTEPFRLEALFAESGAATQYVPDWPEDDTVTRTGQNFSFDFRFPGRTLVLGDGADARLLGTSASGWVAYGRIDGDTDATMAAARADFARLGLPEPTFRDLDANAHIC